MSTLQTMIAEINGVSTTDQAVDLVKKWMPDTAADVLTGFMSTSLGTKNCSLMAEWVATRYRVGIVDWAAVTKRANVLSRSGITATNRTLPFTTEACDVFYVSAGGGTVNQGGHELIVIRDGSDYGLFHAWDGEFELFPKLNDNRGYNVVGAGENGKTLVLNALTSGWTPKAGCEMATVWDVKRV